MADLLVSLVLAIIVSPLLIAIWVAVKLDSPGPGIYRQTRIGMHGEEFRIYKFRTMQENADKRGGFRTETGDPRVTRVGQFLRRTSLDELPQIFNVIKGHMSLVGPRPDVPAQRDDYTDDEWRIRHSVRPGITGLAQSTLRSDATVTQRKQLDLYYADRHSLGLDLKILGNTFVQVVRRGGN